jgi:hypothetical protein
VCVPGSPFDGATYHLAMRRAGSWAALTLVAAALLALGLVDAAWLGRSADRASSGNRQEGVLDALQREYPVVQLHSALGVERVVTQAPGGSVRGLAAFAGVTAIVVAACVVRRLASDGRARLSPRASSRYASRAPPASAAA